MERAHPSSEVLRTERLVLRAPVEADAPVLAAYYARNDERFAPWKESRSHDAGDILQWIRAIPAPAVEVTFLAFDESRGTLVAVVGLGAFSLEDPPQATIAYTVDAAYEGAGYATEAVRRVVEYARADRHLKQLAAYHDADNARSERLLQRLGFVALGRTPVIPGFEKHMRSQVYAVLKLA